MENIIQNWPFIVLAISVIVIAANYVVNFFQRPTPQQIQQVIEWAVWATAEAEKIFGSKTGKLKLRYVYDKFLERFDYLAKLISFEQFSELVDKALAEMKRLLSENKNIQSYIGVEVSPEEEIEESEKTE